MQEHHRRLLPLGKFRRYIPTTLMSVCLLLLPLVLAGCGATTTHFDARPSATSTLVRANLRATQGVASDGPGPVAILRNPAPGTLDISLSVQIDQEIGDTQSMTAVALGFRSGGESVQFAGAEKVTCNGATLPLRNRLAVFQVLRSPTSQVAGTSVRCDYVANGTVASVTLHIPAAPAITSPATGAQVARSTRQLVTYSVDPATTSILGLVALSPGSASPKALAQMNTPGPLQATIDTSAFAPGPGQLVLSASLNPHVEASGAAFHAIQVSGMAYAQVSVTWI